MIEVSDVPGRLHRAVFTDVLASEWIKLRSLRTAVLALAIAIVLTISVGAVHARGLANALAQMGGRSPDGPVDPTAASQFGIVVGQIGFAVAGVLAITSEHSSGMIRTSLAAVPGRGRLLAAKGAVYGATALSAGLTASLMSFLTGQALLAKAHVGMGLTDPGAVRAVIGGGLYLAAIGLLAFAPGALFKSGTAGLSTALGLVIMPLGFEGGGALAYAPSTAGLGITTLHQRIGPVAQNPLAPGTGYFVLLAWIAVLGAVAYVAMQRRDA